MKLNDLKQEAEKDLEIHRDRLDIASSDTPILHNKYSRFLIQSREQLNRLERQYEQMYKDKWLYYLGKAPAEVYKEKPFDLKVLKGDVHIFLDADDELNAHKYKIEYMKTKIKYLKGLLEEIGRRSFHISNINKSLKYYNGEID